MTFLTRPSVLFKVSRALLVTIFASLLSVVFAVPSYAFSIPTASITTGLTVQAYSGSNGWKQDGTATNWNAGGQLPTRPSSGDAAYSGATCNNQISSVPNIDFEWPTNASPQGMTSTTSNLYNKFSTTTCPTDQWLLNFRGTITFPDGTSINEISSHAGGAIPAFTTSVRFCVSSDDGYLTWISGILVAGSWYNEGAGTCSSSSTAGEQYDSGTALVISSTLGNFDGALFNYSIPCDTNGARTQFSNTSYSCTWGDRATYGNAPPKFHNDIFLPGSSYALNDWFFENTGGVKHVIYWSIDGGAFKIIPPAAFGIAKNLIVNNSSITGTSGSAVGSQPVLTLADGGSDNDSAWHQSYTRSDVITASVSGGDGIAKFLDRSTSKTATASRGVATFTDLGLIGTPGQTYTITYTSNIDSSLTTTQTITLSGGSTCTPTTTTNGSLTQVKYTGSGCTATWTPPSGVSSAQFLVVAGGGGGAGGSTTAGGQGGGGGGGFLIPTIPVSTATTASLTVGAGGSGGTGSNTSPTSGSYGGGSSLTYGNYKVTADGGIPGAINQAKETATALGTAGNCYDSNTQTSCTFSGVDPNGSYQTDAPASLYRLSPGYGSAPNTSLGVSTTPDWKQSQYESWNKVSKNGYFVDVNFRFVIYSTGGGGGCWTQSSPFTNNCSKYGGATTSYYQSPTLYSGNGGDVSNSADGDAGTTYGGGGGGGGGGTGWSSLGNGGAGNSGVVLITYITPKTLSIIGVSGASVSGTTDTATTNVNNVIAVTGNPGLDTDLSRTYKWSPNPSVTNFTSSNITNSDSNVATLRISVAGTYNVKVQIYETQTAYTITDFCQNASCASNRSGVTNIMAWPFSLALTANSSTNDSVVVQDGFTLALTSGPSNLKFGATTDGSPSTTTFRASISGGTGPFTFSRTFTSAFRNNSVQDTYTTTSSSIIDTITSTTFNASTITETWTVTDTGANYTQSVGATFTISKADTVTITSSTNIPSTVCYPNTGGSGFSICPNGNSYIANSYLYTNPTVTFGATGLVADDSIGSYIYTVSSTGSSVTNNTASTTSNLPTDKTNYPTVGTYYVTTQMPTLTNSYPTSNYVAWQFTNFSFIVSKGSQSALSLANSTGLVNSTITLSPYKGGDSSVSNSITDTTTGVASMNTATGCSFNSSAHTMTATGAGVCYVLLTKLGNTVYLDRIDTLTVTFNAAITNPGYTPMSICSSCNMGVNGKNNFDTQTVSTTFTISSLTPVSGGTLTVVGTGLNLVTTVTFTNDSYSQEDVAISNANTTTFSVNIPADVTHSGMVYFVNADGSKIVAKFLTL